jgi:hypothetical protein
MARKRKRRVINLRGYTSERRLTGCRVELRRCLDKGKDAGAPARLALGVCKRRHRRCLEGARR